MYRRPLGLYRVGEAVPRGQRIFWDVGFLVWGAAMLAGGWALVRARMRESPGEAAPPVRR